MSNKLMYTPNDNTQNYPSFRLQLLVETFGNPTYWILMKVQQLLIQWIRKWKLFVTSVINIAISADKINTILPTIYLR